MANRCTLHKFKIDEFVDWLDKEDIEWRDGKGDWQVLQVKTDKGWSPIYTRIKGDHLVIQQALKSIVKRFIQHG